MLEVKNVTVYYESARVLFNVNLSIDEGESVTVIGPNGAGKTTLLWTISGLVRAKKGTIIFNEEDISNLPSHAIVNRGLIHCPERRRLFPEMSVVDNLEIGAYLRKNKQEVREDLEKVFEIFPVLKERKKQIASTLSGGEQQMLAIGRALMSKPKLLTLDEPSLGLAPKIRDKIAVSVNEIRKAGVTILLVEQDVNLALNIADRGYVLEQGRIRIEGTKQELLGNPHVRESYLGIS